MAYPEKNKLVVPAFLRKGDTIGIITPASPYDSGLLMEGQKVLRQWGFEVRLGRAGFRKKHYLAGSDRERAEELTEFFLDPELKAVICSRGGYGTMRLLEHLDFKRLARVPKIFMGFSDITVLLLALWQKTRLMTFHGPMVTTLTRVTAPVLTRVRETLEGNFQVTIQLPQRGCLHPGQGRGFLLGGNLTLLTHLIGTPFEPQWDQAVLFLEDEGEDLYRLDRLFMHLRLSGVLGRISALLLGQFVPGERKSQFLKMIREVLGDPDIPVWSGMPVGHGARNIPLPIGAPAFFDGVTGLLTVRL
jgi:muramoyltetrapeptide carboxypeptidase